MKFDGLAQNFLDLTVVLELVVVCPQVYRKLSQAIFADLSGMPLVGHLRRVLAPFGNNSVGIDKSVFGNGVCGQ